MLQITRLGKYGGWGNQLFQYCAGKAISRKLGTDLQVPSDWCGRALFKIKDPPIVSAYPTRGMDLNPDEVKDDTDLWGYFQNPKWYELYTEEDARSWLEFNDNVKEVMNNTPRAEVAAHVRTYNGYGSVFCQISSHSYIQATNDHNLPTIDLWVSDANPRSNVYFNNFRNNNIFTVNVEFMTDFLHLMRAKILLRGNSTFSWWASTLGNVKTYSPVVGSLVGPNEVKFVEGNQEELVDLKTNAPGEPGQVYGKLILGKSQ